MHQPPHNPSNFKELTETLVTCTHFNKVVFAVTYIYISMYMSYTQFFVLLVQYQKLIRGWVVGKGGQARHPPYFIKTFVAPVSLYHHQVQTKTLKDYLLGV